MGVLKILEGSREEICSWTVEVTDEVDRARRTFREYRARGFLACRISGGTSGTPVSDFDPDAEEIFMMELAHGG